MAPLLNHPIIPFPFFCFLLFSSLLFFSLFSSLLSSLLFVLPFSLVTFCNYLRALTPHSLPIYHHLSAVLSPRLLDAYRSTPIALRIALVIAVISRGLIRKVLRCAVG
jgi:hypothetical protein